MVVVARVEEGKFLCAFVCFLPILIIVCASVFSFFYFFSMNMGNMMQMMQGMRAMRGGGGGGGMPGGMPGGGRGMPGGMPGMGGDDGGSQEGQQQQGDHVPPNGGAMPDMSAMMGGGRQRKSNVEEDAAADLYNPDLIRMTMYVDGVGAELSGDVKFLLHKSWAPLGVEHLANLVLNQVYDGVKFFRVVPDFIVQFGIPASPIVTRRWSDPIKDVRNLSLF